MQKTLQLTLGLGLKDEATFENFYPGSNQEIIPTLKKMLGSDGEKCLFVCAVSGQGLSHLLQASCHYAHSHGLTSAYLPLNLFHTKHPEIIEGFECLQLICIDDLQSIAGDKLWEEAIFHLFNRIYDVGSKIIIAANDLPKALNLKLPDLVSRLSWGGVYQIHPLTDHEKMAALMLRAHHRGITLSAEVAKYIMTHCSRNMRALFAVLDTLDKASLAAQRRLTVPFVKEILLSG